MILLRLSLCALLLFMTHAAPARLKVVVEGVDGPEKANILQRLAIKDAIELKEDLDDARVQRLHGKAEDDIREALQPFGYYSPQIESTLSGEAPDWIARYQITPGAPVRVTHVELLLTGAGAEFPAIQAAAARPLVREGEVLKHQKYNDTKTRLIQIALSHGFLDAQFTRSQLRITPSQHSAEVLLTMDAGPRYFFGPVTVEQEGLRPELVARYLRISPGAPYDPQQVLDTQFALTDLDYFQSVEILPQRESTVDGRIPITIKTTPRPGRRYEAGAGYGTDTGARVSAGVQFRRLNRHGHKARIDTRLSEVKNVLGAEYRIPLGDLPSESLSFSASSIQEKFKDGESLKYIIGPSLNRTPGDWQRRLYLQYEHEQSDLTGVTENSDLLVPGMSLNRDETDNPIHTRRGWGLFIDVHGAHQDALSTASFIQVLSRLRAAYPLNERVHFLGRVELGASLVDEFSDLPPSQRFYAGGDQSVRGYGYQSLGPKNEEGKVVGGRYLTVASIEANVRVWGNWGAAAFIDAGGADNDPGPQVSKGAGLGLRYRAPIGYLNFDVAHPLDGDSQGVRFHLSVRVGL